MGSFLLSANESWFHPTRHFLMICVQSGIKSTKELKGSPSPLIHSWHQRNSAGGGGEGG